MCTFSPKCSALWEHATPEYRVGPSAARSSCGDHAVNVVNKHYRRVKTLSVMPPAAAYRTRERFCEFTVMSFHSEYNVHTPPSVNVGESALSRVGPVQPDSASRQRSVGRPRELLLRRAR